MLFSTVLILSTVLIRYFGANRNMSQNTRFLCYCFCLKFVSVLFFTRFPSLLWLTNVQVCVDFLLSSSFIASNLNNSFNIGPCLLCQAWPFQSWNFFQQIFGFLSFASKLTFKNIALLSRQTSQPRVCFLCWLTRQFRMNSEQAPLHFTNPSKWQHESVEVGFCYTKST